MHLLNTLSLLARKTPRRSCQRPAGGFGLFIALALLLAACNPPAAIAPTAEPLHKAHFVIAKAGSYPLPTPTQPPTATDTSVPPTSTDVPPTAQPPVNTQPPPVTGRTHYTFYLTLDYIRKAVAVNE